MQILQTTSRNRTEKFDNSNIMNDIDYNLWICLILIFKLNIHHFVFLQNYTIIARSNLDLYIVKIDILIYCVF